MSAPHPMRRATDLPARAGQPISASHEPSVARAPLAMEDNGTEESLAIPRKSDGYRLRAPDLQAAYARAIDTAGLTDSEAAAVLKLSASQLSRQLRGEPNYHLSVQRLEHLPRESQIAFVQHLAQGLGLDVTVPDGDALVISELLLACSRAVVRFRMLPGAHHAPAVRRVG